MPTFLSDPPPAIYLVLGFVVLITGVIAAQRQTRKAAVPFLIAAGLLLVVFLIDRFVDSPREQAVKSAKAMAAAVEANRPDDFVKHVAGTLAYNGEGQGHALTQEKIKSLPFWPMLRQLNPRIEVWNFSRDDVRSIDDNTIEIGFMAKAQQRGGMEQQMLYVRATFKRQPDGSMKMTEFRTFDSINNRDPYHIPGFGP
ncbi:hypothetical protein R5W23_004785 [Gemmata sp. JC673]|uniref:DUF4440 domain-containing protein n=1 Tax=Gemmata algarum TaxID=2975278 RepID=A0ABU5F7M0_9BACT|nr:hypothetical protein [Gemmata algarum]MDY3563285.1 hypothetical protein [Gemmata algarum]